MIPATNFSTPSTPISSLARSASVTPYASPPASLVAPCSFSRIKYRFLMRRASAALASPSFGCASSSRRAPIASRCCQSRSSGSVPPDMCTSAQTVMQNPRSAWSSGRSTHRCRAAAGNALFNTYTLGGSASRLCRAAPVFFAVARLSSFISYPKMLMNFTCACATIQDVRPRAFEWLEMSLLTSARSTGAPSRYCENSIRRITSATNASRSSAETRVITAAASKESSWVWYAWVCVNVFVGFCVC